ncbi:RNA polymerase sigma factor (sigma-70 family) [Roseovarius sp. MBR-78]
MARDRPSALAPQQGCVRQSDPARRGARNPVMFIEPRHSFADSAAAPSPHVGRRAMWRATRRNGTVSGVASEKRTRAQQDAWVAAMIAVRDARDEAAFARLFGHFAPRVKAFLMRSGADATLAEECAQETMAALWHKAHLFDPSRASVATWIFTIARNRRIDALRRQRRPEPEDLPWGPEPEPDQADALALQQDSAKLAEALATLPEKQRVLIEKAYFGDLSQTEIAEETGLPLGTIKSRIRLALDRLRHAMK